MAKFILRQFCFLDHVYVKAYKQVNRYEIYKTYFKKEAPLTYPKNQSWAKLFQIIGDNFSYIF